MSSNIRRISLSSELLIAILVAILVTTYGTRKHSPATRIFKKPSALIVHTDLETGYQYLSKEWGGGLVPRVDKDGNHMRIEQNDAGHP